MNVLHIHTNVDGTLTAIEREYNEEAKYVETFATWQALLQSVSPWLNGYAWVEVHPF